MRRRLGEALGLPAGDIPVVLGRIGNATERHELDMRSMNTALWQATWGYYLTNMVGMEGTGLTPDGHCLGARPFRDARAQRRAVCGHSLRQAAVRRAAGDLAGPVAASRR